MSPTRWMTRAQYARHRSTSRQAVSAAISDGRVVLDARTGLIDSRAADKRWRENTDLSKVRPKKGKPAKKDVKKKPKRKLGGLASQSFADSRARLEEIKAQMADLELLERRGAMVSTTEVRDVVFTLVRQARDMMRTIPDRTAPLLAGLTDEVACHSVLSKEIDGVLDKLEALGAKFGSAA